MSDCLFELDIYQTLPHCVTAKAIDRVGGQTHKHSHLRAQLIYATSGVMRVETEEGCWVIPPLRGVWIPPQVPHIVHMMYRVEIRSLYVRPDIAKRFPDHCCLVEISPLLRQLIVSMTQEPVDYDENGKVGLMAQLALLEMKFLKTPALHLPLPSSPKLLMVCQHILNNPADQTTLDVYADQIAMTTRTLARKFEKETKLSFRQWRQQARLIEGLTRLAEKHPIISIANDLGYANASAFSAMFKRVLGVEPRKYFD